MERRVVLSLLLFLLLGVLLLNNNAVYGADSAAGCPPWSYYGTNGPQNWGYLCPAYATCATGEEQSPVNIDPEVSAVDYSLTAISFNYLPVPTPTPPSIQPAPTRREATIFRTKRDTAPTTPTTAGSWQYNGHTVQMNWPPGDYITGGPLLDKQYNLVQFHFHSPSENNYNSISYPLEIHLVHQASDGSYAVIAVFFEANNSVQSSFLDALATNLPVEEGLTVNVQTPDLLGFVTQSFSQGYWYFMGSFTTPPCTEGVVWLAATRVMQASQTELNAFAGILLQNERPRQPLNSRVISQYVPPHESAFSPLIITLSCLFIVILLTLLGIFIVRYKISHGTY